jgi:glycosyltransferase involved in cell wall biosynthesis
MGTDRWRRPPRGADFLKRLIAARRLRTVIRASGAQLLHVNLLSRDSWQDLALARRMGLRTIGHVQSLASQRPLRRRTLEACDAVLCISECVRKEVEAVTDRPRRMRVYPAVSRPDPITLQEKCAAKKSLGLPPNARVLSSVAMLDPRKGHDVAIAAFTALMQEFPELFLVIAGGCYDQDQEELDRLQHLAGASRAPERILFTGYQSDMRPIYAAADIVLALSRDGEAFGRVPIEAAAHGRVAIGTALGATPELILDGRTGFVVPPGAPEAVADLCRRILIDEPLAERIGHAGSEHVAQHFSPDRIAQEIEGVYHDLLEACPRR